MRRPLDWIVVSISLIFLLGNRMSMDSGPIPVVAAIPDFPLSMEVVAENQNPFAYIREDGSQVFLPAAGPRLAGATRPKPKPAINTVYTWSLPMVTPGTETLSLQ